MESKGAVEAALFSSAQPLRVKDISDRTGLSETAVRAALKDLVSEYDERGSAIKIAKIGPNFCMQLREEYVDYAGKFSEMELTRGMMKTVVTIAYNQPVMQSELCRNLGPRVYDDVRDLVSMGLISGKQVGQTLELTTTRHFSEYFGIEGTKKDDIRKWLEKNEKQMAAKAVEGKN